MRRGFFTAPLQSKAPPDLLPQCGLCQLKAGCITPLMPRSGRGEKKVLILGEFPDRESDERGRQLSGAVGQYLTATLAGLGVDLRRDCWLFDALSCHPPGGKPPVGKAVEWCQPRVIKEVNTLKPELIIPLGAMAVKSLIGWLWKEDPGGVNRWAGYRIPCRKLNAWVCPTFHPSHVMRSREEIRDGGVTELIWQRHLKDAFRLLGTRPWAADDPAALSGVRVVVDPTRAAREVRGLVARGQPLAWDLECNMLKPDGNRSRIHSCAISDGEVSVAFPWQGEAIRAVEEFLRSNLVKVSQNGKYDCRFIRKHLGFWPRNHHGSTLTDTMLAQHILDNRAGTKSLKFQAFAILGEDNYDDAVKPFLKSENSNEPNRIFEAPLEMVLKYVGLDTILTMRIARVQARKLGVPL